MTGLLLRKLLFYCKIQSKITVKNRNFLRHIITLLFQMRSDSDGKLRSGCRTTSPLGSDLCFNPEAKVTTDKLLKADLN